MRPKPAFASLLLLVAAPAFAASLNAKLLLKDASNDDRLVGPAPEDAIPQGHTLKVVIQNARIGHRMAADAHVELAVRQGQSVVAEESGALDENGYGEILMPIPEGWLGMYHAEATVDAGRGGEGGYRRLQAEFRVVDAEPEPNVPEALIVALVAIGAVMTLFWWRRSRSASA